MIPGPLVIRKCSFCRNLIAEDTVISGNTFGARYWTDGKMEAPMLPDAPWLVKCQHCNSLLWLDEQERVEEFWDSFSQQDRPLKDVRLVATPSLQDYFTALSTPITDRQKEGYIRLRTWWAGNDPRRDDAHAAAMSTEEIANLHAYLPFLDVEDESERVMKAEVFRELGMFTEAESLLSVPFSDSLSQAVATITMLTKQRVTTVKEVALE